MVYVSRVGYLSVHDEIQRRVQDSPVINLAQVSRDLGFSRRYIYAAIKQMESDGVIEKQRREGCCFRQFRITKNVQFDQG